MCFRARETLWEFGSPVKRGVIRDALGIGAIDGLSHTRRRANLSLHPSR